MKKIIAIVLFSLTFTACHKKIDDAALAKINGYWEIEKAIMPDGSSKEYSINPTIDYFEIKNNKGFRKKVMPQLDGTYLVSELDEKVAVIKQDDHVYLKYTTAYAKWKEELVKVTDEELVLKNEHDMEYHYKKATSFSIK